MITKLILLIAGVYIILYFKTGGGKINRAQEDERTPMTTAVGMLIGAILSIGAGVFIAKDTLGSQVWINKFMSWIDQIVTLVIQQGLF